MPKSLQEFIIYSLVGAVSVILTRMVSRRSENTKNTMELFRYYHSHDLLLARNQSWKFLTTEYERNPIAFDQLFSNNAEDSEIYDALAKVIYFWMGMYALKVEGGISKKVARKLFAKQYSDWEQALRPLYEKTKADSTYAPDWLLLFEHDHMAWLKCD
jgi:hypothetical protein